MSQNCVWHGGILYVLSPLDLFPPQSSCLTKSEVSLCEGEGVWCAIRQCASLIAQAQTHLICCFVAMNKLVCHVLDWVSWLWNTLKWHHVSKWMDMEFQKSIKDSSSKMDTPRRIWVLQDPMIGRWNCFGFAVQEKSLNIEYRVLDARLW